MTLVLSEIEIAWLAGLLEGEGNFGLDTRSAKRYNVSTAPPSPFLRISMTDQDIIERVSKLVNKKCFSATRLTATGKRVHIVHIGDRATLAMLLPRLFPYFGKRRQESVQKCLDALAEWEIWYAAGNRREMAKQGPLSKKLMASKSFDTMSPDVLSLEGEEDPLPPSGGEGNFASLKTSCKCSAMVSVSQYLVLFFTVTTSSLVLLFLHRTLSVCTSTQSGKLHL